MTVADTHNVPMSKITDFVTIASVFYKHAAFLEVAVPFTLICVHDGLIPIHGIPQSERDTRKKPWENMNNMYKDKNLVFYHAVKSSKFFKKNRNV